MAPATTPMSPLLHHVNPPAPWCLGLKTIFSGPVKDTIVLPETLKTMKMNFENHARDKNKEKEHHTNADQTQNAKHKSGRRVE